MIGEILLYGFFSAFGWWAANHYVIEPHFPPPIEKKTQVSKGENDGENSEKTQRQTDQSK